MAMSRAAVGPSQYQRPPERPSPADQQLHPADARTNAVYSAILLGAIGFGALLGALVVATFAGRGRAKMLLAGIVLGVASLLTLAVCDSLSVAFVGCAGSGAGLILFFATGQATMQLGSADHNRGRIMGIWLMVLSGAAPPGHLLAGVAADALGVPVVVALAAGGIAVAAVAVGLAALAGRKQEEA